MRPLPALLAALLLIAAAVVPVAGLTTTPDRVESVETTMPSITTINNTTNQLAIPDAEVRNATYSVAGVDVGTAVQTGSTQLHHRQETLAFQQRFQRTDSNGELSRLLDDRLSAVEREQVALDARQDTAMSQYAAGEISAAEFLRMRMVVNAEAAELLDSLAGIESAPDSKPDYALSRDLTARLRSVEGELRTLTGPVGAQLQSETTGAGEQNTVYIEASPTGYMLATIDGGEYVRETRLDDERDPTLPDQFLAAARNDSDVDRFNPADDRAEELYPWLYERQRPSFTYYGTSGIYELTASHPNGQLTSYVDAGTTNVFYEEQTRELGGIETTGSETRVNGTTRVTLQRTVETGPLFVSVSNNVTSEPVDANVSVDGQAIGATGSDGFLWTVEPSSDYTVNVTTADTVTRVTVADA